MNADLLDTAVDLIPEAWHIDIEDDARSQGCTVVYAAGPAGLRTETIARVQTLFADRDGNPAWQAMSEGQKLDVAFPDYRGGIGSWELLDELNLVAEYVECRTEEAWFRNDPADHRPRPLSERPHHRLHT